MCHSNNFICNIENNYMYNSTFNLFYAVYDTKNKKNRTLKKECYLKINLNVPQQQLFVYYRIQLHVLLHSICFLQFMTKTIEH